MKALKVDFVPLRHVPPWLWLILGVACILLATQQGWQAWRAMQLLRATDDEVVKLAAGLDQARQAMQEADSRRMVAPPYAADAVALAKMASFPLDRVLMTIEKTQVEGVRLTAVDIAADEGSVRLQLEFAEHEGLMRYLDELNAGEERTRWQLSQAQGGTGNGGMATLASSWGAADR